MALKKCCESSSSSNVALEVAYSYITFSSFFFTSSCLRSLNSSNVSLEVLVNHQPAFFTKSLTFPFYICAACFPFRFLLFLDAAIPSCLVVHRRNWLGGGWLDDLDWLGGGWIDRWCWGNAWVSTSVAYVGHYQLCRAVQRRCVGMKRALSNLVQMVEEVARQKPAEDLASGRHSPCSSIFVWSSRCFLLYL